jgi:hypothetical protein
LRLVPAARLVLLVKRAHLELPRLFVRWDIIVQTVLPRVLNVTPVIHAQQWEVRNSRPVSKEPIHWLVHQAVFLVLPDMSAQLLLQLVRSVLPDRIPLVARLSVRFVP